MHRIGRLIALAAIVAALVGLLPGAAVGAGTAIPERRAMLHATNTSRDRHAVSDVRMNRELSRLARRHSAAMARRGTLFHTSDPASVYLRGVRWHYWGENVGVTPGTVSDLEQAFMASVPHRENILNRSYRRVAIGAVRVDGVLWVTVFFYG
jgi:uncharacterized protein YkwD